MTKFYLNLFWLTLSGAALLLVSDGTGFTHIGSPGWIALVFFVVLTIVMTRIALQGKPKSNSRFVTGVMGASGLRMLLCVFFIIGYWVIVKERDVYFVAYFFILYLFFTMFEIMFLVHKLRADKKDDSVSKTN